MLGGPGQKAGQELRVALVWIDVLRTDDVAAARRACTLFDNPRVTQFHDPEQQSGKAWSAPLGLDALAWDVYLLFDARAGWTEPAPVPRTWFHQLGGEAAHPTRYRTGHALAVALHTAAREAGWPVPANAPPSAAWDAAREVALARLAGAADPEQIDVGPGDADERCDTCRALNRRTSCSLAGWEQLLLTVGDGGRFTAAGTWFPSAAKDRSEPLPVEARLRVTGLLCPECLLRAALCVSLFEGVEAVAVRRSDGALHVRFTAPDSTAPASAEELAQAVRAAGFGAQPADTSQE